MTRQEALKRLHKRFGSKFGYRVDPSAPSLDEREQVKAKLVALRTATSEAEAASLARKRELLSDPEYQRLQAVWQTTRKAQDAAVSKLHHFKFTVGTVDTGFFLVKAQGDSWEDIFAKLDGGKP